MTARTARRTLLKGAAWSVPAIAVAGAAPAVAASTPGLSDLAIEVADPPVDMDTWDFAVTVPIYRRNLTTVVQRGSISESITVTNVGSVPAVNPTGTVEVMMRDYGSDYTPVGANQVKAAASMPGLTWTEIRTPLGTRTSGSRWSYTYLSTLQPGESFTIPLKYWVNAPFANVDFNLMVMAWVIDQQEGDYDDNSERIGYVPGFNI